MKKLLTLLLVLIAALCSAFAFGACDLFAETDDGENASESDSGNNDSGNNSSSGGNTSGGNFHTCVFVFTEKVDGCVTNGYDLFTCKDPACGKTEKHGSYAPVGHDYNHKTFTATCTSDWAESDVCSRCGDEKNRKTVAGTKTEHKYVWKETKAATCTADGTNTGTCSGCGATDTESIPATGHSYGEYITDNNATCAKDGTKTAVCALCGDKDVIADKGTATGQHNFGEYKSNNDGTCVKDCTGTAKCENCDATDTQTIPDSKINHNHNYTWTVLEQTCNSGRRSGVCAWCGGIVEECWMITDVWCDYKVTETKAATCTVDGYNKKTCSKCGDVKSETIEATGHKPDADGIKCTVCGEKTGIYTEIINVSIYDGSINYGDLGTLYFELVVTSIEKDPVYDGYMAVYDLYAVQTYTKNGNVVTTRWAVVTGFYGRTADIHKIELWSITEQRNVEMECVLDYGPITAKGFRGGGFAVRTRRDYHDTEAEYYYTGYFVGFGYDDN